MPGLVPRVGGRALVPPHAGVGGHQHPGTSCPDPPAQDEIVVRRGHRLVEPAHLGEAGGPHQRETRGDGEDLADAVVLALVQLAPLDERHRRPHPVHRQADLQQPVGVVPGDELGADHVGVPLGGRRHQGAHRPRVGQHVVVAEEEELGPAG